MNDAVNCCGYVASIWDELIMSLEHWLHNKSTCSPKGKGIVSLLQYVFTMYQVLNL